MQQQSELPEGWLLASLPQVVKINMGQSPPGSTYNDKGNGIPFFQGKVDFTAFNPKVRIYCTEPKKIASKGDILLSIRAPVGPTNIANQKCAIGRGLAALTQYDSVQTNFILHFFRFIEPELSLSGTGSTFKAINKSNLEYILIPFPPIEEQHRIVSAIEAVFARLDAANERLDRVPEIVKRFRQSVLAAACDGRLTEGWRNENQWIKLNDEILNKSRSTTTEKIFKTLNLPETWIWTNIDSVGHVKGGKRLPKGSSLVKYNTSYPYLRAGNLKNGTVEGEILYLNQNDYKLISKYTISSSDVYITIVGACIGDSGTIPEIYDGVNLTENAAKICDLIWIYNQYLAYLFQSQIIQDQIQNKIFSATQDKLALTRIRQLLIPLPPLPEQHEIVRRVDALFALADSIEAKVAAAREKTEKLRQSVLAKAFSGKLVETEAELARREGRDYEPADVLLERIKAERGKSGKKVKAAKGKNT